ncbi:MAG: hypothetical protein LDL24_03115 [Treponema sp.]|nr:hypothetical protein [Treponema sp.]
MAKVNTEPLAWVTAADMGLGHKRAAWPLAPYGKNGVIIAGSDVNTDPDELALWNRLRRTYESLSRIKSWPLVGNALFGLMDALMSIPTAYPFRDLSKPTIQNTFVDKLVDQGLCRTFIRQAQSDPLPIVTTFYAQAIAAEKAGLRRIYCVICDADINRVWVSANPKESRIEYFVPCGRALRRLKQYGVPDERIYMTGFPLPLELIGDEELSILRRDLGQRLARLDPQNRFWPLHVHSVEHFLGKENCPDVRGPAAGPVTITFAVGGAGAQKEIGSAVLRALGPRLANGSFRLNLVAGKRPEVAAYFREHLDHMIHTLPEAAQAVRIVFNPEDSGYFAEFSSALHDTDILWTKPSELSFYTGLGIPIIIAPPIGSQEVHNREWLMEIQGGFDQKEPEYAGEWLWDLLQEGRLAECAWDGFLKARKYGTYKIAEILKTGTMLRETSPLKR